MTDTVLEVQKLSKDFALPKPFIDTLRGKERSKLTAVDSVSFKVNRYETLGLVGESGCGKTTLARCILRLYPSSSGKIFFEGEEITGKDETQMGLVRRKMQVVFQDPYSSLNPRMTVREIMMEAIHFHKINPGREEQTMNQVLQMVGLAPDDSGKYPRAFSGGQRQRIGLARALVLKPTFLVADEPVSALDVSIQAQILNLLDDLRKELDLTMLFIAHELAVVRHVSTHVAVMYLGKIVEMGTNDEIFLNPQHPYTQGLLAASPKPIPKLRSRRAAVEGDIPSPLNIPRGCPFHPRCPIAQDVCREAIPPRRVLSSTHQVLCHLRPAPNWSGPLADQ